MKETLTIIFLLCTSLSVLAQGRKWEVGLEASTGSAAHGGPWVLGEDEYGITSDSKGLSWQYNFTDTFSFCGSFLYQTAHQSWSGDWVSNIDASGDNYMKYLVIPICAKLSYGKYYKFFIKGGPCFSYLLDETKTGTITDRTTHIDSNYTQNPTNRLERVGLGLYFGMGVDLYFSKWLILSFELRQLGGFPMDNDFLHSTEIVAGLRCKL